MNPLFYQPDFHTHLLSPDESRHIISVLRYQQGDTIELTDGKGKWALARIASLQKNQVEVTYQEITFQKRPDSRLHLYVAPTKQTERMEWMVEKLVEVGMASLTFIVCKHSERTRLRMDRLQKKAIAALKQSRRLYLPPLHDVMPVSKTWRLHPEANCFMAHLPEQGDIPPQFAEKRDPIKETVVWIGPEGGFSSHEVQEARAADLELVLLGNHRLRTETAAIVAAAKF